MMIDFCNRPGMVSKPQSWAKEIAKLNGKVVKITYRSYRNEMPYVTCDECGKIIPLDCLKIYNEADNFAPDEGVSFF